jgi:hypothetical protein
VASAMLCALPVAFRFIVISLVWLLVILSG